MKSKTNSRRSLSLSATSALFITLCASSIHAVAELVANGDFSDNAAAFTSANGYFSENNLNPSDAPNWTTTGSGINGTLTPTADPFAPVNNVPSFLFMQLVQTASQAITTVNVTNYLFSFDAAARDYQDSNAGVSAFADSALPPSLVLDGSHYGWLSRSAFQRYAFGFTATGPQTIQFVSSGTGDYTTDITNVSVTDAVSNQLEIADGTLFFANTSGTANYGFSLTGTNQTIYRRPGNATYTGNITTDASAGALTFTANEAEGANNLIFSGSAITLGAKSLNVTANAGYGTDLKVTLTNSTLTTSSDVSIGRGALEISGNTNLVIGGQLSTGAGGDWANFVMNPGTTVTTTGGVNFTANGVVASTLNFNGGTLTTPSIHGASFAGISNVFFNGTTVVASVDNSDFLQVRLNGGVDTHGSPAYIKNGGAIFDTNGHNLTIQNILADSGGNTGSLTKQGSGTLTLTGANTYTGTTTVNGGVLAVNGTSTADTNQLVISGGKVNLTGAETVNTLFFGAVQQAAGTYSADGTNLIGSGTLIVTTGPAAGYSSWATTNAPTGTAADDFDGDGVNNGVEYVLGGTKLTNDLDKLPQISSSGANEVFTFNRSQASINGTTTVAIEVGTTLLTWPDSYNVPGPAQVNVPGVTVVKDTSVGFDTVTLTVPRAPDAKKFARMKVTN